ncbi:MAG: tRNA (mo5U34)-methyltransferase [Paracoccaceae bacterium]|jgi:tRNA (mo5U34)-methyltransferase
MIDFNSFFSRPEFQQWHADFKTALAQRVDPKRHGDLGGWLEIINSLPEIDTTEISLNQDTVTIGSKGVLNQQDKSQLHDALFALKPWRKGPYQIFDTFIDTEWRSDWKWQRVSPHIASLAGRTVLDVGCGTGYHCWRMLGDGADYVLGIDPSMRFIVQHMAVQKYAQNPNFDLLPIGIEDMPGSMPLFDSVFSMGVLYHRRNPINHIIELKNLLASGGELVLETLIIDHIEGGILTPKERYAQMRNVWSIMTVDKIISLIKQAGFTDVQCVDQNVTSLDEQRRTDWMQFHSLKEFLDPHDVSKTIEGYPAPKRGLFIATKR